MSDTTETTVPTRQEAWAEKTSGLLFVLSIVFILAYSLAVLLEPLSLQANTAVILTVLVIWLIFIVDYIVRVVLSTRRWHFFYTHIPDLIAVVVPIFRPLVQLGNVTAIPYFKRKSGAAERLRLIIFAIAFIALFIYTISLAVLAAERHAPGATITTFGDAVWWAFVTMTSTGYGDFVPITVRGRVYAVLLMFGGLSIIGIISATVLSYLTERIASRVSGRAVEATPDRLDGPADH